VVTDSAPKPWVDRNCWLLVHPDGRVDWSSIDFREERPQTCRWLTKWRWQRSRLIRPPDAPPQKENDIEAVAEAIELVESHSSEEYAKAAIAALSERGWQPPRS
jgi:hypothetical protein